MGTEIKALTKNLSDVTKYTKRVKKNKTPTTGHFRFTRSPKKPFRCRKSHETSQWA